jgi:hypothetical protein
MIARSWRTFEHAPDASEGAALSRDADVQLEQGTHNERDNRLRSHQQMQHELVRLSSMQGVNSMQ